MLIKYKSISHFFKLALLSSLSGILSGASAALFLHTLNSVTNYREAHEGIIWFLPIAGLCIGLIYKHFGKDVAAGNNLILQEIHDPKKKISPLMAPLIYLGTVATHLFGGSAGREGTAVQMSASLSDQLSHFFQLDPVERKAFLVLGAGAGFGAAIGAPLAGIIFGMEVIYIGQLKPFAVIECTIASIIGYLTTVLLHTPHTHYIHVPAINYSVMNIFCIVLIGGVFGLVSRTFSSFTHALEHIFKKISAAPLKPFVGGTILVLLYKMEGSYLYDGLGIDVIKSAFQIPSDLLVSIKKIFFTALTLASGFKGGEFIPLVFIGATIGSAFGLILPLSFQLMGQLGFAAVFAGASNTPLACSVMAMELFGWKIGPYALLCCYISYYCSGDDGIYKTQKKIRHKHHHFIRFTAKVRKK